MLVCGNKLKGDTLIEVLIASSIFGFIAIAGVNIMNQGVSTAQRALEISLVRQEMDAQASTLRFLNSSYVAAYQPGDAATDYPINTPAGQWARMVSGIGSAVATSLSTCPSAATGLRAGSFILNTRRATFHALTTANWQKSITFSQINYNASDDFAANGVQGIWIEAVRTVVINNNQGNAQSIDFHIRACWESPGQSAPITLGTIVRLYEPR